MRIKPYQNFIIVGITKQGKRFRPGDWAERLSGAMSQFGADQRMRYSPYVRPCSHEGDKCVFVDARIHDVEPMAYTFLVNFARDNELKVIRESDDPDELREKLRESLGS